MNFKDMDLADNLITALNAQNIKQPTDIQQQLFAPVLDNRDVIGCSQTGSGKTLAYRYSRSYTRAWHPGSPTDTAPCRECINGHKSNSTCR